MSWSNDTRCLFCDGKLPLFRKVSQGQFCSKAHQESYWKEQNQLAVEVLHRTHDTLQAYRPAASIESILGPQVAPAAHLVPDGLSPIADLIPEMQGLRAQASESQPIQPPVTAIITADPLEYEIQRSASKPCSEVAQPPVREFKTLAGMVALCGPRASEPAPLPLSASVTVAWMAVGDTPLVVSSPVLTVGGLADLALTSLVPSPAVVMQAVPLGISGRESVIQPLAFPIPEVRVVGHSLAPYGDVLERIERDVFPLGKTLLALCGHLAIDGGAAARDAGAFTEFPAAMVERPQVPPAASTITLAPTAELFGLGTIAARNPGTRAVGEAASLEPRARFVEIGPLRVEPVVADPVSDLMGTAPHAPLMDLATGEARGFVQNPVTRPVSYQPFAVECAVRRPDSRERRVALPLLEIRSMGDPVFARDLAEKLQPHAGGLRLRPGFVAAPLQGDVVFPKAKLAPVGPKSRSGASLGLGAYFNDGGFLNGDGPSAGRLVVGAVNFWHHAPRDLKMLLFAVPLALGLAFHPSLPKVSFDAPQANTAVVEGQFEEALHTRMAVLRKTMAERAAVGLDENFRQGLDNWMSNSGSTAEWSFDQAGFVQPGRVALYQPSLGLTDYEFQFLGAVDQGALSWVTRAVDFQNYYVVKLVVVKGGPVPQMGITRYAVINGKAVDRVDTPVTFSARTDSLYRVSMVMDGDHYSLVIQGQMIDSWTEPRLKRGGVGFFTNSGEQSRIGWVQITHQYDMLGRLFAYLAP